MTSKLTPSIALNSLAALLSVALAGCAHSQASSPTSAPVPPALVGLMPLLLADAAQRSGGPRERLVVIEAFAVTWSDSSLGCPRPGLAYLQVLVPGHRVRIATPAGVVLDYHVGTRERWVHCPAGRAQPPSDGDRNPRI